MTFGPETGRRILAREAGVGSAALVLGSNALIAAADVLRFGGQLARYFAGRSSFRGRDDDIYIASYPRSGTTWLQVLLHHYVNENVFDFPHLSAVSPFFERALSRGLDVEHLPSPRVFKTHLTPEWLKKLPGRIVYIARNPADVCVSYYHFHVDYLGFGGGVDEFYNRFKTGRVQYGRWDRHAGAWAGQMGSDRILMLDYRTLKRDPAATLDEIVRHCGLREDGLRRAHALRSSAFEMMKQHERQLDPASEMLWEQGVVEGDFVRRGAIGEGALALSATQASVLAKWVPAEMSSFWSVPNRDAVDSTPTRHAKVPDRCEARGLSNASTP